MNRTIESILPATESHLPGDFVVHRALPRRELRRAGGFVFLDHFDERNVTPELFDVPPHPHVGLQTVTYLFEGEAFHTDSLDNEQTIRPGEVNWMTAGRAITHAEQVTRLQPRSTAGRVGSACRTVSERLNPPSIIFPLATCRRLHRTA